MMERSIDRKEHDIVKQITTLPLTYPRKIESDLQEKRNNESFHFIDD
jgi:hypothetical protein